ncbi:MAG TPA: DUF2339 domain-containing protein, partial [Steroidobacteraceae bacterium]|nr:DUF2339 domain-containing protein [Steroidobacteraceae bacterium]
MTILWIVVGALVGASLEGIGGFLLGGLLGLAIGKLFDNEAQRTRNIAARLDALERDVRSLRARPIAPPADQAAAPSGSPPATATPAMAAPSASPPAMTAPPVTPSSATPPPHAPRRTPAVPAPPERVFPAPASPGWIARLLEGNIVAKLGVVILFLGVGFLLKYAYDRVTFPPAMRIFAVALAGFVMLWLGRRWMPTRRLYALILMGGGLGVCYLDVFFALKTYALISAGAAFGLFFVLGAATALSAVRLEAKPLAALGLIGAFLAPILASTGEGRYGLLFSYYALLNLFILALSWFRSWRELNLIGFAFTFLVAGAWGLDAYTPADYALAQSFLVVFFLIYLVVPVLFALRQPPELKGLVDGTLVFGTPTICAFLQWGLVRDMGDYALATSAAIAAAVYGALAVATVRVPVLRVLRDTYLALAIALATLAVFFALDAYPTFAFWALEAAALLWLGLRQRQAMARACALGLQGIALVYFVGQFEDLRRANPWFNDATLGLALIALSALLCAWLYTRYEAVRSRWEHGAQGIEATVAAGAWLAMLALAFEDGLGGERAVNAFVATAAASALAADLLGARARIPALRRIAAFDVAVYAIAAGVLLVRDADTPLASFGWIAWPLALGCSLLIIQRHERASLDTDARRRQVLVWLLLGGLATWHGWYLLEERRHAEVAMLGLAGIVVAALRFALRERARSAALRIASWAIAWSSAWWLLGVAHLLDDRLPAPHRAMAFLMVVATTLAGYEALGGALGWSWLRRLQVLFAPILGVWLAWHVLDGPPPLDGFGALAWPSALALWALTLWRCERDGVAVHPAAQHASLWAIGAVALAWGVAKRFGAAHDGTEIALIGMVLAALLALASWGLARGDAPGGERWPFDRHHDLYRDTIAGALLGASAIWSVIAQLAPGSVDLPAPYLPLVNPLDLAQAAALLAMSWHVRRAAKARSALAGIAALGFLWLNGIALRTIHSWADVPYELADLLASALVQAVFALLWTATALVLMTYASRARVRPAWVAGACLLAIVIVKLFVNDIAQ